MQLLSSFDAQRAPQYYGAYAARLVGVAPATLARWTTGPVPWVATPAIPVGDRRYLSFLALAECWGIRALRRTGWTPARLTAALDAFRRAGGPVAACASQRFLAAPSDPVAWRMTWDADPDCPTALWIPLGHTLAQIDPLRRFGHPHLAGVPVQVLWERIAAGEPWDDVAADYDLPLAAVHDVATHWPAGGYAGQRA